MANILIVDDSEVDLRLTQGLLRGSEQYEFTFARNGIEAVSQLEARVPDIVLTDLIMPNMDGLELVSHLRDNFPLVPVVLMTAKGNEEIAAEALLRGAASYVPKRLLTRYLERTVGQLLVSAREQRSRFKLLGTMRNNECVFSIANDIELVPTLVGYFQEGMSHLGLGDDADRLRVSVALEEAISNAIHHGNLEVSSELRERDDNAYYNLIRERQHAFPYCQRTVEVRVRMSNQEAKFDISDEGPGFDVSKLPDPTDPMNLEKASGRGITLMKAFMDDVYYNESGNAVTLIKRSGKQLDAPEREKMFLVDQNGSVLSISVLRNLTSLSDRFVTNDVNELLNLIAETEHSGIIVDLQKVTRFGSSFLAFLRRIRMATKIPQNQFGLCNVSELGREILKMSGVDDVWKVFTSLDAATDALKP